MQKKFKSIIFVLLSILGMMQLSIAGNDRFTSNAIVFISFSMPAASIKGWMEEAEKIHAPVVIRGLVNNSFKDTLKKLKEVFSDNHGGVQLDPILFQRFNVTQVPALVIRKDIDCPPNQSCIESFDIIYGDVHLDFALEKIIKKNDEFLPIAQNLLNAFREKHHV